MICRNNEEECSMHADTSNGDDQSSVDNLPVSNFTSLQGA